MQTKLYWPIMVIVLTIFFSGCTLFKPSPARTVENFYRAVEKGEIEDALSMLSSNVVGTFGREKLQQGFVNQTQIIESKDGIRSVNIQEENIIGQTATVQVEITYGNGEIATETIDLIQEEGNWKLNPSK